MRPAIVWFRRDLRLRDNRALAAAAATGRPVIPVYISGDADSGGASRWWLHHSLEALDSNLAVAGGRLVLRRGEAARTLGEIVAETGAAAVFFTRRYEPSSRSEEKRVAAALAGRIDVRPIDDSLINPPGKLRTQGGAPYRVFTPYWRKAGTLGEPPAPEPAVPGARYAPPDTESLPLAALELTPEAPDWSGGLRAAWQPGEDGALARLDGIGAAIAHYAADRDRPDRAGTSRLSPHLHFGEISVRQVWAAVRSAQAAGDFAASARTPAQEISGQESNVNEGAEALLRQLYWRDFSYYLLYHFPELPEKPLRPEFGNFPWVDDGELLAAWQQGRTGYPIVDAGMRELWHTGWMHNRVRMIVASFLVKDLMIPWQRGAEWFLDTLVDADLANNSAGWQWVAGCGTDAAPYFRIFNPTRQGEKFDPSGDYVRRWVPEAGTANYPRPVVDHGRARQQALEAWELIRGTR